MIVRCYRRPAPFTRQVHALAGGAQLCFAGEPIAETVCAHTAYVHDHVRHGIETWRHWPRCRECLQGVGTDAC